MEIKDLLLEIEASHSDAKEHNRERDATRRLRIELEEQRLK
jgi:hypothetical protein